MPGELGTEELLRELETRLQIDEGDDGARHHKLSDLWEFLERHPEINKVRAAEGILKFVEDSYEPIRAHAAWMLGKMAEDSPAVVSIAIPELLRGIKDGSESVRLKCARAVQRIAWSHRHSHDFSSAVPQILEILPGSTAGVKKILVRTLGVIKLPEPTMLSRVKGIAIKEGLYELVRKWEAGLRTRIGPKSGWKRMPQPDAVSLREKHRRR